MGLAFRLIIAYVLLPGSGFGVDRGSFQAWAGDLAAHGPGGFYRPGYFADYTPGYLYVLWLLGIVGNALGGIGDLIKLPAILSDVALAWLVHSMVLELGGPRRGARLAAIVVLINPVTWFDSAIWGQVDSFGVVFLLLGLRELWRGRIERAAILAVVAAIIKPQLGILIPILIVVAVRRHFVDWLLARRSATAAAASAAAATTPATTADLAAPSPLELRGPPGTRRDRLFDRLGSGPVRLASSAAVALGAAIVLCLPFGLSLVGLFEQVVKAAAGYPYLTVNAYNPWALVEHDGNGLAANGTWPRDSVGTKPDEVATLIAGVPAVYVGTALLLLVIVLVGLVVAWRGSRIEAISVEDPDDARPLRALVDDRRTLLVALTVLAIAFFVVPTRVHERYMFPAFALGAILAATSLRWRVAYLALSIATFANLYAVLLNPFYKNPGVQDWLGLAEQLRTSGWITIVVLVHLAVFLWALMELRPGAVRQLDAEALVAAEWERADAAGELEWETALPAVRGEASGTGRELASAADHGPGLGWLPSWLSVRALLPDRSRRLHGEPGGRFDRLDLWLLVVIVMATLTLRTFRLAEPYRMHFDEVYHARTATEFLQDWRYGQPHAIYEFTHPHLAKYAMAVGLIAFGDDRVTAQRELGTAVQDVLVEPRWTDPSLPDGRAGDRFYVAGGDQLRAYDLATRRLIATWTVPGAQALALDRVDHRVFVGTADGTITVIDTRTDLDLARTSGGETTGATPGSSGQPPALAAFAHVGAAVVRLAVTDDATGLVAATSAGQVVSLDPATGATLGQTAITGALDLADGGTGDGLTVDPASVKDRHAAATTLAGIVGRSAATYERRLAPTSGGVGGSAAPTKVVVLGGFRKEQQAALVAAIADGRLANFAITPVARIAVAGGHGVTFVAPATGEIVDTVELGTPATGLAKVVGIDKPSLYVAQADRRISVLQVGEPGGTVRPSVSTTFNMPGSVRRLVYDDATQMVHALGTPPGGTGDTIYVIEPHGNAVYADARLPFTAQAIALDANGDQPSSDREQILAVSATGSLGAVDVGNHAFAWRLPGVLAGALMAGLLFLLIRLLFRRRDIALLASVLALADGMLFVQSRIAMNDVYVGLFIVAAYALFAPLWTGRWSRPWAFWLVLPLVGVLLGLALASKWVGLYALAGVLMLILGRSALGRILLIGSFVLGTTVLGYMALAVPKEAVTSGGNLLFAGLMIAITLVLVLVAVLHPIAWSDEETRLAVGGPAGLGLIVFLAAVPLGIADRTFHLGSVAVTPIELAFALVVASGAVYLLFRLAGSWGLGPLAPPPAADDPIRLTEPAAPAPVGWLRPGAMFGLPMVWVLVCLAAIPLAVYVASYLPWVALGNRLTDSWPPGHSGQTLIDLTKSMYDYHNGLRATHPASSPYWAWPLDLKPVWFYQQGFAAGTSGAIYDAGNLVAWWLALPALGFAAWQAFRRRSLGLTLILVAFAMQWLPWSRIDRATFQYHYYTAVPFLLVALAYFLAELRNGPSARTWLLARVSATVALLGPALLWLFKGPLCGYVRVTAVDPGSEACVATAPGQIVLTARVAGLLVILIVFTAIAIYQLVRLGVRGADRAQVRTRFLRIAAAAAAGVLGVPAVRAVLPDVPIINQNGFAIEPIALVVLVALLPVAWVIATARNTRRFVVGALLACLIFFVAWYPNLSGLPLPAAVVNAYQGLLPTYLYAFQFPVNTDPVVEGLKLISGPPILLFVFLVVTCVVVGYSAWTWRISLAERDAERRDASGSARLSEGLLP